MDLNINLSKILDCEVVNFLSLTITSFTTCFVVVIISANRAILRRFLKFRSDCINCFHVIYCKSNRTKRCLHLRSVIQKMLTTVICLSFHLSVCQFCLSVCPSIFMSVCQSVCLSVLPFLCLSFQLYVYPSNYMSALLFVCLYIHS